MVVSRLRAATSAYSSDPLADQLFEIWTRSDPKAAISALNSIPEVTAVHSWKGKVVRAMFGTNPELTIETFSEWKIDDSGFDRRMITKWAASDPRHAAEWTQTHPAGSNSEYIMEIIGKEWARTDPLSAMDYAVKSRNNLGSQLAKGVFEVWTQKAPEQVAGWLTKADPAIRHQWSGQLLKVWAESDSTSALSWCHENLIGSRQVEGVAMVVGGIAGMDINLASEMVTQMQPSRSRSESAAAVAKKWSSTDVFPYFKEVSSEAKEWIKKLDTPSIRRVMNEIGWRWSEHDLAGFENFVSQLPEESIPAGTYVHQSWKIFFWRHSSPERRGASREDQVDRERWSGIVVSPSQ